MRFTSLVAVLAVVYMVIAVCVHASLSVFAKGDPPFPDLEVFELNKEVLLAAPVMMFAFTSHIQMVRVSVWGCVFVRVVYVQIICVWVWVGFGDGGV